jgi:hypothetical protein
MVAPFIKRRQRRLREVGVEVVKTPAVPVVKTPAVLVVKTPVVPVVKTPLPKKKVLKKALRKE